MDLSKHRTDRRRDNAIARIIGAARLRDLDEAICFIAKYITIDTLEVIGVRLEEEDRDDLTEKYAPAAWGCSEYPTGNCNLMMCESGKECVLKMIARQRGQEQGKS